MMFNPQRYTDLLIDRILASAREENSNLFERARIKVNLRLTIVFLFSGIFYGLFFFYRGYYFLGEFTLISSLALLVIPFVLLNKLPPLFSYGIYLVTGFAFAAINIFGSGNSTSIAIMLWLIFVVHLAFSVLTRKIAVIFGFGILIMFLMKLKLMTSGTTFPFWIDETIVHNPKVIDMLMPAFFNFYLAYIANKFYEEARFHFDEAGENIKTLDNRVRESQSMYELIVEKGLSYMVIHTPEGKVLFTNQACQHALGYTEAEIQHLPLPQILDESVRQQYATHINELLLNGSGEGVMKIRNKNNELRFWDFRNVVVHTEDEIKVIGFAQDVTELIRARKNLEESYENIKHMTQHLVNARMRAEESDRLKSLFLANISHEIRTPMNAIMGFSELLERANLSEAKRTEFTRLIRERSYDLLNIINDVLDISKIESGQVALAGIVGNVDELIDRILTNVKAENRYLIGKDIEFRKNNLMEPNQYRVKLDFIRLNQVLNNLVSNAAKFTRQGSIELRCELTEPGFIEFTVTDTGIGIEQGKLEKLFRPFRQADEGINRQYGGSGLGLAICKGLVELMGGTIWVESEPGKGSAFHFTVALRENIIDDKDRLRGTKILIVEDDPHSSSYFMEILEQHGMNPFAALTGKEAMKILESESDIKLALLDIGLPDMSGIDVAKKILRDRNIKVIIITALNESDIEENALNAGVHTFIAKPVNGKVLVEKIKQVMEV